MQGLSGRETIRLGGLKMSGHKPWWYGILTIADLGIYSVEELLELNPAELAEMKRNLGFNMEHLTCSDVYGGEKGTFYFKTSIAKEVPRDFIGEYIPEAHKRGIKVLIYYNVHWLNKDFGMEHPEWLQANSEGRIIDNLYGSGCAPCVNSPYREWSFQGIRDLARYEIDGVFLDGPIFAPGACYCESCQKLFMEEYGVELPRREDWKDPTWRRFIEFRYDSIARYLKDAERTLKEVRPEAIIYMNCTGLWPAWPAARDNRRLMSYQDILGAEGGFLYYDLRTTPLWKPGMAAKLLETQAEGKPTVVFIAGAHKAWDYYLLTPAETKLLYADTVANGANPWYGIPLRLADNPGAQAAGEMNRFLLRNSEYLEGTRSLAKVALFWSSRTADYYRASVPVTDFTPQGERLERREAAGNFYRSFLGCYEAFVRSHIPFDVIDEDALTSENLSRYDMLVMPNCACLSMKRVEVVREYIKGGGNLIASFEASRYDEYGGLRDEFGLSDVFGVRVKRGTFGPMRIDYMAVADAESPVMEGLTARLLPCPVYGIEVEPTTARPLALYLEKMPARYVRLPQQSENPAILINRYGEGRCLYIAGNLFEHYHNYHISDHRRIIANTAKIMAEPLITLENCPSSVEVTIRQQPYKGRTLVHFVNFTAEMTRPIESVVALKDIDVTLHGFDGFGRAKALWLGEELDLKDVEDGVRFTVPTLKEYEVVALEP